MRVAIDVDACVCSGACVIDAPSVFQISDITFVAQVSKEVVDGDLIPAVEAAALHCPAQAVLLTP